MMTLNQTSEHHPVEEPGTDDVQPVRQGAGRRYQLLQLELSAQQEWKQLQAQGPSLAATEDWLAASIDWDLRVPARPPQPTQG